MGIELFRLSLSLMCLLPPSPWPCLSRRMQHDADNSCPCAHIEPCCGRYCCRSQPVQSVNWTEHCQNAVDSIPGFCDRPNPECEEFCRSQPVDANSCPCAFWIPPHYRCSG